MSIAFIHSGKSFMPEIGAYISYFRNLNVEAASLVNPSQAEMQPYDILWFFMGIQQSLDKHNKKKFIVHEYASASTPPFARTKDLLKKYINPKPELRITLTTEHRGVVFPNDNIPLIIRKQGIHDSFYERQSEPKNFDFIYTGSALRQRHSADWLRAFSTKLPGARILLVGNHEPGLIKEFRSNTSIVFEPAQPVTSLPKLLSSARFAVNYVPDIYPFNIQPSTKLLEYCAAGCKVISNRYQWVNHFSQTTNAGLFFFNEHFEELSEKNLEAFHFDVPDMQEYKWHQVFYEMKLNKFLPL